MKLEELKQVVEWAIEGKLQYKTYAGWIDLDCANKSFMFSSGENFSLYRRKPEPKLRPWKPEEVPVGALLRGKMADDACLILRKAPCVYASVWDFNKSTQCRPHLFQVTEAKLLKGYLHSTDGGKTWKPCGVEEGV